MPGSHVNTDSGRRGVLLIRFDFFSFREEMLDSAARAQSNAMFFRGVEPTHPAIGVHAGRERPTRYLVAAPCRRFEKRPFPQTPIAKTFGTGRLPLVTAGRFVPKGTGVIVFSWSVVPPARASAFMRTEEGRRDI